MQRPEDWAHAPVPAIVLFACFAAEAGESDVATSTVAKTAAIFLLGMAELSRNLSD
jgi:hypothetical protein